MISVDLLQAAIAVAPLAIVAAAILLIVTAIVASAASSAAPGGLVPRTMDPAASWRAGA